MNTVHIHDWAASRGMAVRVMPVAALERVRLRLERLAAEGALDAGFVKGWLSEFRYLAGGGVAVPRSLVLLALPRPAHIVGFRLAGRTHELVLPPTYVAYTPTFGLVRDWFRSDLGLDGGHADLVSAPLKSLAATAGLIRYGRNNIGYVEGLGSFVQLIGLATSLPLEPDGEMLAIEDASLGACSGCRACAAACRTGAIGPDRFLLRAERCFTRFSESADAIPETVAPPSTDCLIGCLKCQEVCPANKGLLKRELTGVVVDPRETEALLSGAWRGEADVHQGICDKISTLRMTGDIELIARNLRLFLGSHTPEADRRGKKTFRFGWLKRPFGPF